MAEPLVFDLLAAGFLVAAAMHFARAGRPEAKRPEARRSLGAASMLLAVAALLYEHEPRWWCYVAMGAGGVMVVVAAVMSARESKGGR